MNDFLDLLKGGVEEGTLNTFLNIVPAGDSHTLVGGIVTPPDADLPALAVKIAAGFEEATLTVNVDRAGEVDIHRMTVPDVSGLRAMYRELFGGDEIFLGTGKGRLWIGGGADGLNSLKSAIEQATKPGTPEAFVEYEIRPLAIHKASRVVDADAAKAVRKFRDFAISSYERLGSDPITGRLTFKDGVIRGAGVLPSGVVGFIGSVMADFAKENL